MSDNAQSLGTHCIVAHLRRSAVLTAGIISLSALLAGCGAPPPGAANREIHPGAALVPGGGAPGLNGPFHPQSEYKS